MKKFVYVVDGNRMMSVLKEYADDPKTAMLILNNAMAIANAGGKLNRAVIESLNPDTPIAEVMMALMGNANVTSDGMVVSTPWFRRVTTQVNGEKEIEGPDEGMLPTLASYMKRTTCRSTQKLAGPWFDKNAGDGFGKLRGIRPSMVRQWKHDYPDLDVLRILRRCENWLRTKPNRKRALKTIIAFLNNEDKKLARRNRGGYTAQGKTDSGYAGREESHRSGAFIA